MKGTFVPSTLLVKRLSGNLALGEAGASVRSAGPDAPDARCGLGRDAIMATHGATGRDRQRTG